MSVINVIKKRPIIVVISLLTILAIYLNFHLKNALSSSQINHERVTKSEVLDSLQNSNHLPVQPVASKTKSQVTGSVGQEAVVWVGNEAQNAERLAWLASRGWYDTGINNKDDYKTYSREVLGQLASNGDLNALTLLVKGSKNPERKNFQIKAAVYGSTFALVGLADTVTGSLLFADQGVTDDQRRSMVLEAAAYVKVAEMRGDLWPTYEERLKDIEDDYYKKPVTNEDRQAIVTIASDIYADLESQRMALGLGKFDNSYPPLIRAYYKSIGVLPE